MNTRGSSNSPDDVKDTTLVVMNENKERKIAARKYKMDKII